MMRTLLLLLVLFSWPLAGKSQCLNGDCQNGSGILLHPNGERYIGNFKLSTPHGLGTFYYSDGSYYYGYWQAGNPDGAGIKTLSDGRKKRGLWRRGTLVKENPQLVIEEDGAVKQLQLGCISGNCANGHGIFLHPDGSIYIGDFKSGKKDGIGLCYYPGKTTYRGSWQNNLPNGIGTMTLPDGEKKAGLWQDGQLQPPANYAKMKARERCLSGDCENGYGVYQQADGRRYQGPFKNGKPNGTGVYFFENGERYEGQMKDGDLHGKGALYFPDGRIVRGFWQTGKYVASLDVKDDPRPPALEEEPKTKIWAVVIGIASYEHMQVLRFTDDDAYRFYAFLKSPEGGALPDEQIQLLIDESATRQRILKAMEETFSKAGEEDLVLLYFSGHGIPGAFLPIDFDGLNNKIFHQEISSVLASSRAKYKVCIADACHSGGLLAVRTPQAQPELITFYQNLSQAQPGTALIMSSKSNETSLESQGLRHGVFSHYLIRGLKGEADSDQNKIVTIKELYQFIHRGVTEYTDFLQSPVIRGNYDPKMPVAAVRK